MRNAICLAVSALIISACTHAEVQRTGSGIYTIKQPQSKYDLLGQDQLLATGDHDGMAYRAKEACPHGYEKLREYMRHLPDRNSYYAWEIRCMK